MSDSLIIPWSDNPNAPKIPYVLYYVEKVYFAGFVIGAIFYGTVTCTSVRAPSSDATIPPQASLSFYSFNA